MKASILTICIVVAIVSSTVECKSTINKRVLLERLLRRLADQPVVEETITPEEAQNTGENGGNPGYNPFEDRSLKNILQHYKRNHHMESESRKPVVEEQITPEEAQNTGENGGNPGYNPFEE